MCQSFGTESLVALHLHHNGCHRSSAVWGSLFLRTLQRLDLRKSIKEKIKQVRGDLTWRKIHSIEQIIKIHLIKNN